MAPRKKVLRSDTAHVQTDIIKNAVKEIPVPSQVHLEPEDMPFWKSITDARAQWTEIDLIIASNLARCLRDFEENNALLREEGSVILNSKGVPIQNPRIGISEILSRRSTSLQTKLQVHAGATQGESKQARNKNTAKAEAIEAAKKNEKDDLIPGLNSLN